MKLTLNFSQFCDMWPKDRENQFSYQGKKALFEFLEELEESGTIQELEFDPIALCCEYTEYEDLKDYNEQNGTSFKSLEELEIETSVIKIDKLESFIAQNY